MTELFFQHGPNLALYKQIGDQKDFWSDHWQSSSIEQVHAKALSGGLDELEKPLLQYLPVDGIILEAGCGTGKYVWALQARGFTIEGIDFSEETINNILLVDPTANVRIGDIFSIDRPDGFYSGYLSFGVLEHNYEGPEAGLVEAWRVLKPGGIALISVPYLNNPRKTIWKKSSEAPGVVLENGLRFYQDYVDMHSFKLLLEKNGFTILKSIPQNLFTGLVRDIPFFQLLEQHGFFSYQFRKLIKWLCISAPQWIKKHYSHMILFIVQKTPKL